MQGPKNYYTTHNTVLGQQVSPYSPQHLPRGPSTENRIIIVHA